MAVASNVPGEFPAVSHASGFLVEVKPYRITVSGPNADANEGEGYFAGLMDDSRFHALVRSAYGPSICTTLETLRRVVSQDYWLTDAQKDAASDAIDARLREIA